MGTVRCTLKTEQPSLIEDLRHHDNKLNILGI
jgi:hypothetical protein